MTARGKTTELGRRGRQLARWRATLAAALLCLAASAGCLDEAIQRSSRESDAAAGDGRGDRSSIVVDDRALQADGSVSPTCAPSAELLARVSPARILADLNALTASERSSSQGQARAAQYLKGELAKLAGLQVREQTYPYAAATYSNVEATLAGTASAARIILAGAHYDCVPGAPGADDNASGSVALLEAARVLATCQLPQSIRWVWFSNEELGFIGSTSYVSDLERSVSREQLIGALIVDMVGYARPDEDLDLGTKPLYRTFAEATRAAIEQWTPLKVKLHLAEENGNTDERAFWVAGYTALFAIEEHTATGPLNPHYHKATDTVSTLDQAFLANVTRGLVAALATFAQQR